MKHKYDDTMVNLKIYYSFKFIQTIISIVILCRK